jgi:hypothetical protein
MFALLFLVPEQTKIGLTLPLLIICLVAISITISQGVSACSIGVLLSKVLIESVPSFMAFLGIIAVIICLFIGIIQSLVWLLPVAIILLAVAVRNGWNLLVR